MAVTKEQVVEFIKNMSVLELSQFIKELEGIFGVSAAAPVAAIAAGGAAPVAEAVEEKTEFDAILTAAGDKKVQVIKVVRELTNLGLKEAKAVVDGVPQPIKTAVSKDEAAKIKQAIEEAGGQVEIK